MTKRNDDTFELSIESLKGKQSVRATFQLPDEIIDLLGLVASQFGLQQKSLFDQLIDDREALRQLADSSRNERRKRRARRAKTYVLSKRSLDLLDLVSKKQSVPRDVLVENSIKRLLPLLHQEKQKHRKRTEVYQQAKSFFSRGQRLLTQTRELLGESDPAFELVRKMAEQCQETMARLGELVAKGESIAQFQGDDVADRDVREKVVSTANDGDHSQPVNDRTVTGIAAKRERRYENSR